MILNPGYIYREGHCQVFHGAAGRMKDLEKICRRLAQKVEGGELCNQGQYDFYDFCCMPLGETSSGGVYAHEL